MAKAKAEETPKPKFKPIPPTEQSSQQKADVAKALKEWTSNPVVKNWHGYWKEWIAWWEGNQYVFYNTENSTLEDVSPLVDRDVKNTYNRITSMIRQMHGEIRYPHSFYVEPNTTESEDITASKLGSHVLEYTNIKGRFNQKINRAKLWGLVVGNIFWKEWWNPELSCTITDGKGGKQTEKGAVDYNYVNPFNVRLDPLAKSREGWRWFVEGKTVAKSSVESEFGIKSGDLPSEAKDELDEYTFERQTEEKTDEATVTRIEYWQRPTKERPKGRFMVVTKSGWLLWDGNNPAAKHDIPYFHIPGILPRLNDQYYDSVVRLLQDAQRLFNRYCSIVDEHIEYHRPKALIPENSLDPAGYTKFTRQGVDFIVYKPIGIQQPHWQSPPPLPDFLMNWIIFLEKQLETSINLREVSMARLPKYSTRASGVLFQGLKKQDEIVLIPTLEEIDTSLLDVMTYRLELIQKHYTPERLVKVTGKNKTATAFFLKGAEIRENTDVRVKAGVALFSQKEKKDEVVSMLIEKGLITDPRKALELLDTAGLDDYMDEEFVDERQADRENDMMKDGNTYPTVSPDDDQDVHYTKHNNQRKMEEFKLWKKKSQDWLLKHINEHKLAIEESMKKVQEANQPPAPEEAVPQVPGEAPGAAPGAQELLAMLLKGQGG